MKVYVVHRVGFGVVAVVTKLGKAIDAVDGDTIVLVDENSWSIFAHKGKVGEVTEFVLNDISVPGE